MIERIEVGEYDTNIKTVSFVDRFFGIFKMKQEPIIHTPTALRNWKDWEVDYLKENHEHLKLREMAEFLDRPISTIYSKMRREGIIKRKE